VIDVRFTPDATKLLRSNEMTRCAISGCEQVQQGSRKIDAHFNHLVGKREQHSGNSKSGQ
jgi:hypothetical protein